VCFISALVDYIFSVVITKCHEPSHITQSGCFTFASSNSSCARLCFESEGLLEMARSLLVNGLNIQRRLLLTFQWPFSFDRTVCVRERDSVSPKE